MMDSKKDFINYLKKSLIPYLITIGKVPVARDFQEALYWMAQDELKIECAKLSDGLTKKEHAVMIVIANDDMVSDDGWWSEDAKFWTNDLVCSENLEYLNDHSVPGILSSLCKKGMIVASDGVGCLTDQGRQWLEARQKFLNIPKRR
jgi:hypothetical protein